MANAISTLTNEMRTFSTLVHTRSHTSRTTSIAQFTMIEAEASSTSESRQERRSTTSRVRAPTTPVPRANLTFE
ncbi:unnamed protein product [Gordionus sp. m RMFG-2023]